MPTEPVGANPPAVRSRLLVRGRVQGVGFRYFVWETARQAGISGWVRNLNDGSVEIEAEASKETLENFIRTVKTRHAAAQVQSLSAQDIAPRNERIIFDIR
ncbi:MAG: acylphosphatase [Elusimicrobiota bacterium]